MNDYSPGYAELPRTAYLDHTLRRARTAAEHRSHRYVTLEHLLLTLLDDPDAIKLLQAVGADIAIIQSTITNTINNKMAALVDPSGRPPDFSYKFDTLFAGASEDAIRAGRREIDGALALIAIAKDPDTSASAILAANGFNPQAALHALGAGGPVLPVFPSAPLPPQPPLPSRIPAPPAPSMEMTLSPRPEPVRLSPSPPPGPGPAANKSENFVEDMLATVRNILDEEDRKERVLPSTAPPLPAPSPPPSQQRLDPYFRNEADRQRSPVEFRSQAPYPAHERAARDPRLEPSPSSPPAPDRKPQAIDHRTGFSEPKAPGFDLGLPAAPKPAEKRRKAESQKGTRGGSPETPAVLAKILESIPRRARLARGEVVQIRLTREDAARLFARRRPPQNEQTQPASRAVTIRLSAPEGGFFIETMTPETQWALNHPAAGEEAFGNWAWAAVPNETGTHVLLVSVSARDLDANGLVAGSQALEQAIEVHVRRNLRRLSWGLIRTLLLLMSGSALTAAAFYMLRLMGKLPH